MSAISDRERLPRLRVGRRNRGASPFEGIRRRWNEAEPLVAPQRNTWPLALRRARLIGLVILGVQLVVLCIWSAVLAHRFALTEDFAAYSQAVYLISHGTLNPYSTPFLAPFWKNSVELITWPLAVIQMVWPHPVTLKVLQTLAMVGAEAVAFGWICDIAALRARRDQTTATPVLLVGLGALLLVSNPWYVYMLSFDFHPGPFMVLFLIATARDTYRGRRRAWIWAGLLLASSALGGTYVIALGIGLALSGRFMLRKGLGVALLGLVWLGIVAALHGNGSTQVYGELIAGVKGPVVARGTSLGRYTTIDVVKALFEHPLRALNILWPNRVNMWAEISAAGLIGVAWPAALLPAIVILLESGLIAGSLFSSPGLQNNTPVGPLVTVGTIALLAALVGSRRYRRVVVPTLLAALAINATAWAAIWLPQVPGRWLTVSPGAAATLREISTKLRPADEVVASQGVIGGFAGRQWLYTLELRNQRFPVKARKVWVIIAPRDGIEVLRAAQAYADVAALSHRRGWNLEEASNDVWAFEWTAPKKVTDFVLTGRYTSIAPWTTGGAAGTVVTSGKPSNWHVGSGTKPGYTFSGDEWRKKAGRYRASVTLSVERTANVEVWDDSTNKLLTRTVLPDTHGRITVQLPVDLRAAPGNPVYGGWGPWRMTPQTAPPGDLLEIRVWSPGGKGQVKVYDAGLQAARTR
jgi:uncharacterized membrane protein